jgi:hypothetical protein
LCLWQGRQSIFQVRHFKRQDPPGRRYSHSRPSPGLAANASAFACNDQTNRYPAKADPFAVRKILAKRIAIALSSNGYSCMTPRSLRSSKPKGTNPDMESLTTSEERTFTVEESTREKRAAAGYHSFQSQRRWPPSDSDGHLPRHRGHAFQRTSRSDREKGVICQVQHPRILDCGCRKTQSPYASAPHRVCHNRSFSR